MFVKIWRHQKNRNQSRSYKNTSRFQHVKLNYDAAYLIKSMVKYQSCETHTLKIQDGFWILCCHFVTVGERCAHHS